MCCVVTLSALSAAASLRALSSPFGFLSPFHSDWSCRINSAVMAIIVSEAACHPWRELFGPEEMFGVADTVAWEKFAWKVVGVVWELGRLTVYPRN